MPSGRKRPTPPPPLPPNIDEDTEEASSGSINDYLNLSLSSSLSRTNTTSSSSRRTIIPILSSTSTSSGSASVSSSSAASSSAASSSSANDDSKATTTTIESSASTTIATFYHPYEKETKSSASDFSTDVGERTEQTRFNRFLNKSFYKIGLLVTDHSKTFIVLMLIFTTICSVKILFTPQEDDIRTGYTPRGARSHVEAALYEKFYSGVGTQCDPMSIVLFLTALDGGTMHRETHLNESIRLLDEMGTRFKLAGKSFYQFCNHFCQINEPIRQFRNGLLVESRLNAKKEKREVETMDDFESRNRINLTFPFITILGQPFDMSPYFFGVQQFPDRTAFSSSSSFTNIKYLKLIVMHFRAERPENASKQDVVEYERKIEQFFDRDYKGEFVRSRVMTVTFAADEIVRTGMTLFPYISVGFVIMSVFSLITVFMSAFYFDQWTTHKVSMAIAACVCPLLATSSALGFLFWFGFRFGTILAVSPFLVMAIGVDDAYLMIHSWQRICADRLQLHRNNIPGMHNSLRDRIAEMMVDVGPSITITSLTNVLAFVVGIFSPTPEIQLFCAGNAMAIFFDFVYQLFLFGPIVALAGRFEIQAEKHKLLLFETAERRSIWETRREMLKEKTLVLMSNYCQWIANGFTTTFVFLLLLVYWMISIKGALNIVPNITPKKLFLADSLINDMNQLRDTYILPNYTAISVFVNVAGNLSDSKRRQRVFDLIDAYESLPNNLGPKYTHFWLRDYDKYTMNVEEEFDENNANKFNREEMSIFLNWPEYRHWGGFMRFDADSNLSKFFATLAFHGVDLVNWDTRNELLRVARSIAANYSELDAWVWVDEAQFLDQIQTLVPVTIQSSLATLLCMMIVCFVFMSNFFTVIVATFSIVSICIGVFGFLSMWNVDLDPISMATTIMSIGFSVDFPAHITYHYYRCGQIQTSAGVEKHYLKPEERIYHSLNAIGFPLLQCGFSTILFVLCLLFVDTYMSEVFVKTIVLVVSLGLFHGLFIVPTLLCALSGIYNWLCNSQQKIQHKLSTIEIEASIKDLMKTAKNVPRKRTHQKNIVKIEIPSAS